MREESMEKPGTQANEISSFEQFLNKKPLIVSCEFIQGYTIPLNIKMKLGNETLEYSSISGVFIYTNRSLPEIFPFSKGNLDFRYDVFEETQHNGVKV